MLIDVDPFLLARNNLSIDALATAISASDTTLSATSDGGAALIVSSVEYAEKIGKGDAPRVAAISTVTPTFASEVVEMPDQSQFDTASVMGCTFICG